VRRDLKRVCAGCALRTHLIECPACAEKTSEDLRRGHLPRPVRFPHAVALLAVVLELVGLPLAGVALVLFGLPNMAAIFCLLGGTLAVLLTMLLWTFLASLVGGFVEGLRGGTRRVAFGGTRARRDWIDRFFALVRRWADKAHEVLKGPGYFFGSLLAVFGFVAVAGVDLFTDLAETDIRVDVFGAGMVLLIGGLTTPPMSRLAVAMLTPEARLTDPSRSGDDALRKARRERTRVEGVATAAGPLLTDPTGQEVLAYRVRGRIGRDEVDDGDAIAFDLTDDDGREGRVEAEGPVLVALEEGGEPIATSALDSAFLDARGLRGRGAVTIHRLRPGDRVRVSADFDRAGAGFSYRDSVSTVLRAGEEPLVLEDPG